MDKIVKRHVEERRSANTIVSSGAEPYMWVDAEIDLANRDCHVRVAFSLCCVAAHEISRKTSRRGSSATEQTLELSRMPAEQVLRLMLCDTAGHDMWSR